jgi:hypothetical protein
MVLEIYSTNKQAQRKRRQIAFVVCRRFRFFVRGHLAFPNPFTLLRVYLYGEEGE